jgi:hypothetical protein
MDTCLCLRHDCLEGERKKERDRRGKQGRVDGETRTRTAVHVCACISSPRAAVARRDHRMQRRIDREARLLSAAKRMEASESQHA